jgi:sugar lactone lactonase YvrE
MRGRAVRILAGVAALLVVVALGVRWRFGGGQRLEDRTTAPRLQPAHLEPVANLDHPPGNVAVSADGRVFFTYHPDGNPPVKVAELVGGRPVPYPDEAYQKPDGDKPHFQTPLALRIDAKNRLWVLDHAGYATGQPRLIAFDLATGQPDHLHEFPPDVAPFLSMVNDFQISPDATRIYIAEASPIRQRPALIVYDVATGKSRRVLDGHPSVQAQDFLLQAPGRDMVAYGLYALKIPVDSIALDVPGEWLYFGPLSGDRMYRIRTADLDDESLAPQDLAARVEDYGPKTISDGLTTDVAGNVYVSDPEHSAVLILTPERKLVTLVKDGRLRWPDGFSFGPDGWLYVTASALQDVLFVSGSHVRAAAPFQIFRFKPGPQGVPGR